MLKSKFAAAVASASLVASLGLVACGGQQPAASTDTSASTTTEETKTEEKATETEAKDTEAKDSTTESTDADKIISWQGALEDGTLVDYLSSEDNKNASIVIKPAGSKEEKRWLGSQETAQDGKLTITDDTSKETISFTISDPDKDGVRLIEVDGYGKGAMVGMTAADWDMVAKFEEAAKTINSTVDWVGALEDGTLVYYIVSDDGAHASMSITSASTGDTKMYLGGLTTAEDGKATITDETTKESVSFTLGEANDEGTAAIEIDGLGKGTLLRMTVGDYVAAELA